MGEFFYCNIDHLGYINIIVCNVPQMPNIVRTFTSAKIILLSYRSQPRNVYRGERGKMKMWTTREIILWYRGFRDGDVWSIMIFSDVQKSQNTLVSSVYDQTTQLLVVCGFSTRAVQREYHNDIKIITNFDTPWPVSLSVLRVTECFESDNGAACIMIIFSTCFQLTLTASKWFLKLI